MPRGLEKATIFLSSCSEKAVLDGKKAIRGGIPIVFRKLEFNDIFLSCTCKTYMVNKVFYQLEITIF